MHKCKVCGKPGSKGFYRMKVAWLSALNLPPDFEIKDSTLVCFRHFKRDDFYFISDGEAEQMKHKKCR